MENLTEIQTDNGENARKDFKQEKNSTEYPQIKVQLPKEAALKVQTALHVLKERKADTKVDELLAEFLNGISDEYLAAQVERRTPEDYYFEAAKSIPELREKIIQQAKKALQGSDKIVVSAKYAESKRPKKKASESEPVPHKEVKNTVDESVNIGIHPGAISQNPMASPELVP